ncbi:MAG: alpha/beta hydrolase, partial [bacterium]
PANIQMIPFDLPIFMVSGEEDPVGDYGRGVRKVYEQYLKNGITNVSMKLYPDMRHEILNEVNHDIVDQDLLRWLEDHLEDL